MKLDTQLTGELVVVHRRKDDEGRGLNEQQLARLNRHGLLLDTCQRQLLISDNLGALNELQNKALFDDARPDIYRGTAAYSFLLQTATGLNSLIAGESNILGQFRQAWHKWRDSNAPSAVTPLHIAMQNLLADSRTIRHQYLQGIGGNSYGSLVRKLLEPDPAAQVLFVGTGRLTRSMLPLFSLCSTAVWNHRPSAAQR